MAEVIWDNLNRKEQVWLVNVWKGNTSFLKDSVAQALTHKGIIVSGLSGPLLSDAGRKLLEKNHRVF